MTIALTDYNWRKKIWFLWSGNADRLKEGLHHLLEISGRQLAMITSEPRFDAKIDAMAGTALRGRNPVCRQKQELAQEVYPRSVGDLFRAIQQSTNRLPGYNGATVRQSLLDLFNLCRNIRKAPL